MKKQNKNFTIIDWDIAKYIRENAHPTNNPNRKISYSDLLIIFYIKGFGFEGYYGSQSSLGKVLGMTQEQISRSMKTLLNTVNISTNTPILCKSQNTIWFNDNFFNDEYGSLLPNVPF